MAKQRDNRRAAFWRGFFSVFDLGTEPPRRLPPVRPPVKFPIEPGGFEDDWKALHGDWLKVAGDLERARRRECGEDRGA